MAGIASQQNGRKGGRPKGAKATHTIEAERGKAELVRMYLENVRPINQALIDKAKAGDIAAIKELHDRVHGKALQAITGPDGGPIKLDAVEISFRK